MDSTRKTVISLIKSALYKTKTEIPADFDAEKAKNIICRHSIYGLIVAGLKNSGLDVPDWLNKKFLSRAVTLENLWYQADNIRKAFDENGIEYIPLKGIVIKDLYPSPLLRSMSDVDLLIREKDYRKKIKPLMKRLGYTEGVESDHELHWSKGDLAIELHKRIIPSYNKDFYKVIGDGWDWVKDNGYEYIFTHFAKHYRDRGIGISHIVDLEILFDRATDEGLKELRLDKFHQNVRRTLDCWFRDKEFDVITAKITDTVFDSGEYGTKETYAKSNNLKTVNEVKGNVKKAKRKRFLYFAFPPYSVMVCRFGSLKRLPFLLPFAWVWRIICAPFKKGKISSNLAQIRAITEDDGYKEDLNAVGLDFWY